MICGLRGRLACVQEPYLIVDVDSLSYQVLAPAMTLAALAGEAGCDIALHTIQYLEGSPAASHYTPRLVGFVSQADRDFFLEFTKVKGLSTRRALRAMCLPTPQLAAAIEHGDERLLVGLPEIGKKTAAQIVSELRGTLSRFVEAQASAAPVSALSAAESTALDILVQWGDRRMDAMHWIAEALRAEPALREPGEIVRAAYRVKQSAGGARGAG